MQPAALGLLLALLAASLLGNWFHRQAAASLVCEEQARVAILEGSALADFVAGTLAAESRGHGTRCRRRSTGWTARRTTTRSASCASVARGCSPPRTPTSAPASCRVA